MMSQDEAPKWPVGFLGYYHNEQFGLSGSYLENNGFSRGVCFFDISDGPTVCVYFYFTVVQKKNTCQKIYIRHERNDQVNQRDGEHVAEIFFAFMNEANVSIKGY